MRNAIGIVGTIAAVMLSAPVIAQDSEPAGAITPAAPGSWQATAGEVILHYVDGRSLADAGGPNFNPFGIKGESLLFELGAFFITATHAADTVNEGELAIFPQFTTPRGGAIEASAATPAIIPFAVMKSGVCYGGYVAGHPVPDQVFTVDMTGRLCHARSVDEAVFAAYQAAAVEEPEPAAPPPVETSFDVRNPLDADLDLAVWAAYGAAYDVAAADSRFRFVRDGDSAPLLEAIGGALTAQGLAAITVVPTAPDEAIGCAPPGTVELRVAPSADGAGVTLVVASPRRMSAYAYAPDVSADLEILAPRSCQMSGPGRASTANEP